MDQRSKELCEQITKSYSGKGGGKKPTLAVVEFSDLSGVVTNFGRLLSEELITKLFSTGNYEVIERLLLNKIIAEHKLQFQGIVDPKSAKELGKILGVDAIVSGTIADLGKSFRVNARVISTETGQVLSVAAATIAKDEATRVLLGGQGVDPGGTDDPGIPYQPAKLPFREDFSNYKDDAPTDWGRGVKVRTGEDGRKWLVASAKGQHPVGRDVNLPANAFIEFDYGVEMLESKNRGLHRDDRHNMHKVLSGITLVDEAGAKYRIEWTAGYYVNDQWYHEMTVPSGASVKTTSSSTGTLRIQKKGDTITVIIGNKELTGDTRDFQ